MTNSAASTASLFLLLAACWSSLPRGMAAPAMEAAWERLPLAQPRPMVGDPPPDWLLEAPSAKATVYRTTNRLELTLDNGIIRRTLRLAPNGATVGFDNLTTGATLLRAVKPEAILTLDGKEVLVGGLIGQADHAFLLPGEVDRLKNDPARLQLASFSVSGVQAPFEWKRKRHASPLPWPPPGVAARFVYAAPNGSEALKGLSVTVHYELYDGLPLMGKWLVLSNHSDRPVLLNSLTTEVLAAVEAESAVDARETNRWRLPPISVMSDYSFGGMDPVTSSRVTRWQSDPEYLTQVHYERRTPALLLCKPPVGPEVLLAPGERFESFRVWLVIHDSDSRERQGLALRRAQRTLAPWITENPVMMHVRNADTRVFRNAVDQCATTGFEMIIYTFGSGLDMENLSSNYLARIKADVDYAHQKGIEVGAYSLLSSRRIDDANDIINPQTGKPGGAIFGNAPCLGSPWGLEYFRKIKTFIETTGLDLIEHDGPYPGDVCASSNHPGHRGLGDSQWTQWRSSVSFYQWCRERGLYVNAPDYYFFAGSSKTGMGYREDNWSLPRAQQLLHGRQNIFDGTFEKTPTMGWMFVPLTEYHGGGAAATLEPLSEHLADYEAHLANNFGAGVQACYRGPRLYDTPATCEVVKRWVGWFKRYRDILESDIIHGRRADGRDVDWFLHVNPSLKMKRCGLAMIYNPLPERVDRAITLPLYYTGLKETALIREQEGKPKRHRLARDRDHSATVQVSIPANSRTWLVIERP